VLVIIQPCHVVVWESCVCEGFQDSHSNLYFLPCIASKCTCPSPWKSICRTWSEPLAISTLLGRFQSMVEWCHPVRIHNTALEMSKHVSKLRQLLAHHLFLPQLLASIIQRHHAK
jgi:hypothetical protein